jgi:hypothetical protein
MRFKILVSTFLVFTFNASCFCLFNLSQYYLYRTGLFSKSSVYYINLLSFVFVIVSPHSIRPDTSTTFARAVAVWSWTAGTGTRESPSSIMVTPSHLRSTLEVQYSMQHGTPLHSQMQQTICVHNSLLFAQ